MIQYELVSPLVHVMELPEGFATEAVIRILKMTLTTCKRKGGVR